jgi:hypothetical protein
VYARRKPLLLTVYWVLFEPSDHLCIRQINNDSPPAFRRPTLHAQAQPQPPG